MWDVYIHFIEDKKTFTVLNIYSFGVWNVQHSIVYFNCTWLVTVLVLIIWDLYLDLPYLFIGSEGGLISIHDLAYLSAAQIRRLDDGYSLHNRAYGPVLFYFPCFWQYSASVAFFFSVFVLLCFLLHCTLQLLCLIQG